MKTVISIFHPIYGIHIVFMVLLISFFSLRSVCYSAQVNPDHPRIWINSTKKTQLVTNCSAGGPLRDHYLRVKDYVDNTSESTGNAYAHQRYWMSVLLCAMVDGGSYITKVQNNIALWYADRNNLKYSDYRLASVAMCYDWIFPDLTATDKMYVAEIFKTWWAYWGSESAYFHDSWNN